VIVTNGAAGSVICTHEGELTAVEAMAGVVPLDPTGCGDAFNAGFLQLWLEEQPLPMCASWAAKVAGRHATKVGGNTDAGNREEVFAFYREVKSAEEDRFFEENATEKSVTAACDENPATVCDQMLGQLAD